MDIDRLTELASKIMVVADTERRYKAISNLQETICKETGNLIIDCKELIDSNTRLRFEDFQSEILNMWGAYNVPHECIYLLTKVFNEIIEYENDTEEKRAERKQKLKQYQQTVTIQLSPKKVICHMGRGGMRSEVIKNVHPDLIYCQHGTYRQYSKVCNTFYYRLCRMIQKSTDGDLKTLFQKVCLYIALKNERAVMKEELLLLGVDVPADEVATDKQEKVTLQESGEAKPHYSYNDKDIATKQFANLVEGGYLPSDTVLNDWLYIYGVDGTEPNSEPLRWLKTQSELGYLVQCIWGDTDPQRLWTICEKVFTIKGEKPNTKSMKSKLSNINGEHKNKPTSYTTLDDVLRV